MTGGTLPDVGLYGSCYFEIYTYIYIHVLLVICGADRRMMSLSSVVADVVVVGDVTSVRRQPS